MTAAIAAERACGRRVAGGVYWECGLDPLGAPLVTFLIDPPIALPPTLGVTPRGVSLIESGGVTHVVDWVGAQSYPNVLDVVREVGALGLSRRLPRTLDFARLTSQSRILLVHGRARVENAHAYGPFRCPTRRHEPGTDACIGVWGEDVEEGEPVGDDEDASSRAVLRTLPSVTYHARCRPPDVVPAYTPAFFASFPASRLVVVAGGDDGGRAAASHAHLPVVDVDA